MEPEQLQLGFLKVLKGSKMHDNAEKYGLKYSENPPYEVLSTKWISYDELLSLSEVEEMVELYYNTNQFRHILPVIIKEEKDSYTFYRGLADYYKEMGYSINTPSRIVRYQILLDYAEKLHPEKADLYRELMVYDLYLRENMKSRPSFANDQAAYYDSVTEFYTKEEEQHKYLPDYREYHARQMMKMTHMEVFSYPVWDSNTQMELLPEHVSVLFDYQVRDPLNGDARTIVLDK